MRALVVGAGRMGTFHRRVLRDLGLDVTTVDPDVSRGADYLAIPPRRFDVVCIATPIGQLAGEAARWAGHEGWLLIEKPMCPSVGDAVELAGLLEGQRVAVGYVERFNPQVRALEHTLAVSGHPVSARFTRWNERRSVDIDLDLRSHDVDLAAHLGLTCPVVFDTRDGQRLKRREIEVGFANSCRPRVIDLMAHRESPLHVQWRTFLAGAAGYATPRDAGHVLAWLGRAQTALAA